MMISLMSAGKSAVFSGKVSADLFLDCRVMKNPFRDPVLGSLTGDDLKVQEWIRSNNPGLIEEFKGIISQGLETAPSRNSFKGSNKPFTVCFFCLAGVHRSRGMKHVIFHDFKEEGLQVEVVP